MLRDSDNQGRLTEPGLVEALLHIGGPAALRSEPELSDHQPFDVLAYLGDPDAPADLAAQWDIGTLHANAGFRSDPSTPRDAQRVTSGL